MKFGYRGKKMCIRDRLITEDPLLSWPSDRPDRKIDHILVSPQIQVHHVFVPVTRASDHRPYIADIEL